MKKQIAKRAISLLTALALVLGTVFVMTGQVDAASKAPAKIVSETLWAGEVTFAKTDFESYNNYEKAKLVSIKSSDKKVIKVRKSKKGNKIYDQTIEAKKPGKCTVTLKYKLKGKTYTLKGKYTVKKYPKPLKSISLNGNKISLSKYKHEYSKDKYKKTTAKVKIQPAKGWKITYVYANLYDGKNFDDVKVTKNAITKGKNFKFSKKEKELYVYVLLENKKGQEIDYVVWLAR